MIRLLRAASIAICALLFSSCARPAVNTQTAGHNAWTQSGVLRLGEPDEPDSLNPMFGHTTATDEADAMLFSYLLRYDADGNLIPDLATQVPSYANGGISKDGKTLTFHLRAGARWSDGAPLTAADWMFTYHAVLNPRNNTKSLANWDDIASASAPNPQTVIVHLKQPNATILGIFSMGGTAIPRCPRICSPPFPTSIARVSTSIPSPAARTFCANGITARGFLSCPTATISAARRKSKKCCGKSFPTRTRCSRNCRRTRSTYTATSIKCTFRSFRNISGITVTHRLVANWRHLGINMSRPQLSGLPRALGHRRRRRLEAHQRHRLPWRQSACRERRLSAVLGGADNPAVPLRSGARESAACASRLDDGQRRRAAQRPAGDAPDDFYRHEQSAERASGSADPKRSTSARHRSRDPQLSREPALRARRSALHGPATIWNGPSTRTLRTRTTRGFGDSRYIPPHGANTSWLRDPVVDQTSDAALRTFDHAARKALYQREEERIHADVPAMFLYWENAYTAKNTDLQNYKPAAFVADMWNCWEWRI